MTLRPLHVLCAAALALAIPVAALASSHSEAPGTSRDRLIDDTDLYAFVSPDAPSTVTIVGNWVPLLEPNAGPNFYGFDDHAAYYMNVDNVGDNHDHIRYEYRFTTHVRNGNTFLYNTGPVHSVNDPALNVYQTYTVTRYDDGVPTVLGTDLTVAPAFVGPTSMPDYDALAAEAIHTLSDGSRVFVGPRDDPFFVDLGAVFDLLTIRRLPGDRGRGRDGVAGYNVMTIALQVPKTRLTRDGQAPGAGNAILGLYDSAERPATRTLNGDGTISTSGADVQVSRLGNPLVNELVIPLAMKDRFNASDPLQDGQFLSFVTHSEVAGLFHALYGIATPPDPRNDLVAVFLTGVPGLNQPANVVAGERLRLNMAIPPAAAPQRLGVLAGDLAGFPNGRRLADDVVDIAERVVAGVLVPGFDVAPNNRLGDGVDFNDRPYLPAFPYVAPPWSGFDSPHARSERPNPPGDGFERPVGDDAAAPAPTLPPAALAREAAGTATREAGLGLGPRAATGLNSLRFTVSERARVSLRIYDVLGREVRTLVDQDAAPGTFDAHWDARTATGEPVGRGVYFARFTQNGVAMATQKLVLE